MRCLSYFKFTLGERKEKLLGHVEKFMLNHRIC